MAPINTFDGTRKFRTEHSPSSLISDVRRHLYTYKSFDCEEPTDSMGMITGKIGMPSNPYDHPHTSHFGQVNYPVSYQLGTTKDLYFKQTILEQVVRDKLVPLDHEYNTIIHDRILIRPSGCYNYGNTFCRTPFDEEYWHEFNKFWVRHHDVPPPTRQLGNVYCGFLNLGPGPIFFEYVPHSHLHSDVYKGEKFTLHVVLPGEMLLYDYRIIHRIPAGRVRNGYTAVNFGIRSAPDSDSFWLDDKDLISHGFQPRHFSGARSSHLLTSFRGVHLDFINRYIKDYHKFFSKIV